jgi:glycosyltransferase involved in cell wall biosynthesis
MAQALARLWKDRPLRERLGENARVRFQQQDLTIQRFGRDIENLIAKLAAPVGHTQAVL